MINSTSKPSKNVSRILNDLDLMPDILHHSMIQYMLKIAAAVNSNELYFTTFEIDKKQFRMFLICWRIIQSFHIFYCYLELVSELSQNKLLSRHKKI